MEKYQNYLLALRIAKEKTTFKEEKINIKYLACSFIHACLRCRTLVDTNVLLYELCCFVQGRLKAVLLCLRYLDTVVFGAWFVPAWCAQKKSRFENQNCVVIRSYGKLSPRRPPPLQSCSPRGWYSPVPRLGLRRAPVSRTCHAHTNTRARFLLLLL